jgi:diaminohydroxyphosphoribosylaminopyrimidine deaminase/5-amino-6-(5-phosphoribosylamino)uracil reductase
MVGARTVIVDNPKLNTRDAPGRSPHRAVYDPNGILSRDYHVFNRDEKRVFYFSRNENPNVHEEHIFQIRIDDFSPHTDQILNFLFSHQIGILLVEGGAHLLSLFIRENNWDEGWVIRTKHALEEGIIAPRIKGKLIGQFDSASDKIVGIENEKKQKD